MFDDDDDDDDDDLLFLLQHGPRTWVGPDTTFTTVGCNIG